MVENLQIYKDASELIKRVFIIVKQFPRDYKYTIGTRIQNTALDAVDLIYRASRHKNKQEDLDNLVASLDFLSYLIRISKDMNKVYEFLERPYYSHDFENVEYSNENFDKSCNLKDLHTVKKKVEYNPPRCILPPEIVKKYTEMNMEFWKVGHKIDADIIEKLDKKFIEYK